MRTFEGRPPPYVWFLPPLLCLALSGGDWEAIAAPAGSAPYREVIPSQRQSLWQLLASTGHPIPRGQLHRFLDGFKRLNPDIQQIGALPAGRPLKLPLFGEPRARRRLRTWSFLRRIVKAGVAEEGKAPLSKRGREGVVPHLAFVKKLEQAEGAKVPGTAADPILAGHTLRSLFAALGERYQAKGRFRLLFGERGSISLDLSRFPVVELSSQQRLLFDLKDILPDGVQELLEAGSPSLRVIKLEGKQDLKGLIAQVFAKAGYHSVARESFVQLGERAKVTIKGNWVILKNEDSLLSGQVNIINLLEAPELLLPQPLKRYARKQGILVSEILIGQGQGSWAKGQGDPLAAEASRSRAGDELRLDASGPEGLVDDLLDLLGERYESETEVLLVQDPEKGYQVRLHVNRLLRRKGKWCIIDFSGLPRSLVRMAEAHGVKVAMVGPGRPEHTIETVLDLLQIPYEREDGSFWANLEPPGSRLAVKVPGFVVFPRKGLSTSRSSPLLITDVRLDEELKTYLQGKGVRIVRF